MRIWEKSYSTIVRVESHIFQLKSYQGPIKKYNLNFKVLSQRRKNLRIAQCCAIVDYFEKRKVARPLNFKVLSQRRKTSELRNIAQQLIILRKGKLRGHFSGGTATSN